MTEPNDFDFFDGSNGQFVTERPTYGKTPAELTPFNDQTWSGTQVSQDSAGQGGAGYIAAGDSNASIFDMHQGAQQSGTPLASPPGDLLDSSTSFRQHWQNCGVEGN